MRCIHYHFSHALVYVWDKIDTFAVDSNRAWVYKVDAGRKCYQHLRPANPSALKEATVAKSKNIPNPANLQIVKSIRTLDESRDSARIIKSSLPPATWRTLKDLVEELSIAGSPEWDDLVFASTPKQRKLLRAVERAAANLGFELMGDDDDPLVAMAE